MFCSEFTDLIQSLPDRWQSASVDIRVDDPERVDEAAQILSQCGAWPSSPTPGAFRIQVAHAEGGRGQAVQTVEGTLRTLEARGLRRGAVTLAAVEAPHVAMQRWDPEDDGNRRRIANWLRVMEDAPAEVTIYSKRGEAGGGHGAESRVET